jgi:hypothetical protein
MPPLDATRAARETARTTWFNRELAARNAAHGLALHISQGVCTDDAYFAADPIGTGAAVCGNGNLVRPLSVDRSLAELSFAIDHGALRCCQ